MIICIGESLVDFIPVDEDYRAAPAHGETGSSALPVYRPIAGGCPFNCAVSAARLDGEVAFVGTVSRDFFGDQIVERLVANRVDVSMITRVPNPTTLAFVKKDTDGSVRYAFFANETADRALTRDRISASLPTGAILQFGSISLIPDPEGSAILELAGRERGTRVIAFDPNVRPNLVHDEAEYRSRVDRALRAATLLKTSDEDLAWIYPELSIEDAAKRVLEMGAGLVIVTSGARGSTAYTESLTVAITAEEVEVSDTIGAGDSFLAALLVWMEERRVTAPIAVGGLSAGELREMLGFASRVAAVTCTRVGADPPYRDEVGPL
ncbi:MAG: carbohydrate kinase family protein [Spirochaetales bacterium]